MRCWRIQLVLMLYFIYSFPVQGSYDDSVAYKAWKSVPESQAEECFSLIQDVQQEKGQFCLVTNQEITQVCHYDHKYCDHKHCDHKQGFPSTFTVHAKSMNDLSSSDWRTKGSNALITAGMIFQSAITATGNLQDRCLIVLSVSSLVLAGLTFVHLVQDAFIFNYVVDIESYLYDGAGFWVIAGSGAVFSTILVTSIIYFGFLSGS